MYQDWNHIFSYRKAIAMTFADKPGIYSANVVDVAVTNETFTTHPSNQIPLRDLGSHPHRLSGMRKMKFLSVCPPVFIDYKSQVARVTDPSQEQVEMCVC